jgi:hypothetical protein
MDRNGRRGTEEDAMHMNDLWLDVALRGELDVEGELMARLKLSDGAESGPDRAGPDDQSSALDDFGSAPAIDLF